MSRTGNQPNLFAEYRGELRSLAEISRLSGLHYNTLRYRYTRGLRGDALVAPSRERNPRVGVQRLPEYKAWNKMIGRCNNPKDVSFSRYGGRGIKVCAEWHKSFLRFFLYVGPRPSSKHSIDRIDNNGNYEPGNVRWADAQQQARNRRNSARITIDDVTKHINEWCAESGVHPETARQRINRDGWDPARAVLERPRTQHRKGA